MKCKYASFVTNLTWKVVILIYFEATISLGFQMTSVCEESNGTVYNACVAEPHFVTTYSVNVTVDPPSVTCGETFQIFCALSKTPSCLDCDVTGDFYPSPMMIDTIAGKGNLDTWWQSIPWPVDTYPTPIMANITLSLGKLFEMTGNLKITFRSARPQQMILEKSNDNGNSWSVLQYYKADCSGESANGVASSISKDDPTAVICTSAYSMNTPISGGEVLFPLLEDRYMLFLGPTLTEYEAMCQVYRSSGLEDFLLFTDLRIRLLYPGTDGNEGIQRQLDFYSYSYGISNIEVVARCYCYMHGSTCRVENGRTLCDCQHNTLGVNCDSCLPLYNDRPWKPGSHLPHPVGTANECQKCECNDHAVSCTFDAAYGRGVCESCLHNTTGNHCDSCLDTFYPNITHSLNESNYCTECFCDVLGVRNGDMTCRQDTSVPAFTGQCSCHTLVTGRQCDHCQDGFYGLHVDPVGSCKSCSCQGFGTIGGQNHCNQETGQCTCKETITGQICSQCKDGFFKFPNESILQECEACGCDHGGAQSSLCNETSGECACRPHILSAKCQEVEDGYFIPDLDFIAYQPTGGDCIITATLTSETSFDGHVFADCALPSTLEFLETGQLPQMQLARSYKLALRYSLESAGNLTNAVISNLTNAVISTKFVADSGVNVTSLDGQIGTIIPDACPAEAKTAITTTVILTPGTNDVWIASDLISLDVRCIYGYSLTLPAVADNVMSLIIDSLLLVPDIVNTKVFAEANDTAQANYTNCLVDMLALKTRNISMMNNICRAMAFSVSTQLYNGALECGCDARGTVANTSCAQFGGQCQCLPGIFGRQCDRCEPGFYNFTTGVGCPVAGTTTPVLHSTTSDSNSTTSDLNSTTSDPNSATSDPNTTTSKPNTTSDTLGDANAIIYISVSVCSLLLILISVGAIVLVKTVRRKFGTFTHYNEPWNDRGRARCSVLNNKEIYANAFISENLKRTSRASTFRKYNSLPESQAVPNLEYKKIRRHVTLPDASTENLNAVHSLCIRPTPGPSNMTINDLNLQEVDKYNATKNKALSQRNLVEDVDYAGYGYYDVLKGSLV